MVPLLIYHNGMENGFKRRASDLKHTTHQDAKRSSKRS